MSRIIVPSRRVWTRQPTQTAVIDWSNPITRGLCFIVVPSIGAVDLISGRLAAVWNGARSTGRNGVVFVAGAGRTAEFAFNPVVGSNGAGSGGVSLLSIADPFAENRESCLLGVMMSGSPYKQIALYANFSGASGSNSSGTLSIEAYNGGNRGYADAVGVVDGAEHIYVGTRSGVAGGHALYVDGEPVSVSQANAGDFGVDASSRISIGNESYNTSTRISNARINLSAAWNRVLTSTEVKRLSDNPWQIFLPRTRKTFYSVGSSGLASVYGDNAIAYAIREMLSSDSGVEYAIRNAIYRDDAVGYALRAAISANSAVGYVLRQAIAKDDPESYLIRGIAQSDDADAYKIRGLVQTSDNETYSIRSSVQASVSAAYDVMSSATVAANNAVGYNVRGVVLGDVITGYTLRSSVSASAAETYSVRSAVSRDAVAGYEISAAASSVSQDSTVTYSVNGVVPSGPSAESIAAAVLAALQATTIPANIKQVNDVTVQGAGTKLNPWQPV